MPRHYVHEYDGVGPWHCTECNHDHQGERLAYICIGCPCQFVPDAALQPRSAASGTSSVPDTGLPPVLVSGTPHAAPVVVHADGPSVSPGAEQRVARSDEAAGLAAENDGQRHVGSVE